MTVKLTKKDKILLYVLAIVLIAFCFVWFVVFPQMNKSAELDTAIAELENQKLPMEAAIGSIDNMKKVYDDSTEQYNEMTADFYPYMKNYEIDKMLTTLMVDNCGLSITSLNMSAVPTGVMVDEYHAALTEDEESADTSEASQVDAEDLPILTSSISITAEGERANMQRAVDELFINYPSIRVTGYSVASGEGSPVLTLNCDLYMRAE